MGINKLYTDSQRVKDPDKFLKFFTNCKVLSTVSQDEDEAEWLKNRSRGIGGSDIGTICGVNKYSTPRILYFKKTGQYEDNEAFEFSDDAKERMSWGHKLEPIIADEFQERTGKRVVICPATLQHKDYKWALANVDRIIVDDDGFPVGVLEVKTADKRMLKDWEEGEIPISYIYQLNWYLWILNLNYGAFAALIGGNKFVMIEVYRNDELLQTEMIPAADKFWNENVLKLIEPEVTGADPDGDFIKSLYDEEVVKDSEIALQEDEYNELAELIVSHKAKIKELEAELKEATNKIKSVMKNNEIAYTSDRIITWSPRKKTFVDSERLKTQYPEVYEKCKKITRYRQFSVK